MNSVTAILLAVSCLSYVIAEIEVEDNVLVLTKSNFTEAIKDNEYILIQFYAPWCGHSIVLAPEYAKAAKTLAESGSNIKLAKIDATVETELTEVQNLKGYPTLKFYRNGLPLDYTGRRNADAIVEWVNDNARPAVERVSSVEEAKA